MFKTRRVSGATIAIGLVVLLLVSVWLINNNFRVEGEEGENQEIAGINEKEESQQTRPCIEQNENDENCEIEIEITEYVGAKIVIFYQDKKQEMTKEALSYSNTINYPVERNVYSDPGSKDYLEGLKKFYKESEGKSEKFGYFPIIFIKDRAFSGFDQAVENKIEKIRDENYKNQQDLLGLTEKIDKDEK